jgi:hypothetical protein
MLTKPFKEVWRLRLEPSYVMATLPEGWTLHAAPRHHLFDQSKLGLLRRSMLESFCLQTHLFADIVILHSHDIHPSVLLLELAHGNLVS